MTDRSKQRSLSWINAFFLAGALALLAVSIFAAWRGLSGGAALKGRPIADIAINLNGQPVREHCTSCHVGGALAGEPTGAHPDISPHSVEVLGCTGCHLGEGMALDTVISHGLPGLGGRQVLKGRDLQASCYTCHPLQPLAGAEKAWKGYQLFLAKACDTCHAAGGLGAGGRYGPDLGRIGSDLGLKQIQEAIREPRNSPANSTMPRFPLSRGQAKNISYFLKSRVASPNHVTPMVGRALAGREPGLIDVTAFSALSAEELLTRARCLACHQFREKDGRIAPDLTYIGSMREEAYLSEALVAPARNVPGSTMPAMVLPAPLQKRIVHLLAGEAVGPMVNRDPKHQYMMLCQRCHAANGDGKGLIQPDLAGFPRAFAGNADFFRGISEKRIRGSVEKGIAGTSMPPYGKLLSQEEREALLDLIFKSFIGIDRQDKSPAAALPRRPEKVPSEKGEALFQSHCQRCHGIAGTGTGPESLDHLPRPRNLGNRLYFSQLSDEQLALSIYRGVAGTAMPAFAETLAADEIWGLVGKVRTFSGARDGN